MRGPFTYSVMARWEEAKSIDWDALDKEVTEKRGATALASAKKQVEKHRLRDGPLMMDPLVKLQRHDSLIRQKAHLEARLEAEERKKKQDEVDTDARGSALVASFARQREDKWRTYVHDLDRRRMEERMEEAIVGLFWLASLYQASSPML